MKLFLCVTCLNPSDSFSVFNKEKLIHFTYFYPHEFSIMDLVVLGNQLDMYIFYIHNDDKFSGIEGTYAYQIIIISICCNC